MGCDAAGGAWAGCVSGAGAARCADGSGRGLLAIPRRVNPPPNATLEYWQRDAAPAQDDVVECAIVKLRAEDLPGFIPQFLNRDHADLVAGGLTGVDEVAADL